MSLQSRIDSTSRRIDGMLSDIERREAEARERADAERMRADAAQAKVDALKRVEIADRYDEAFRSFGERVPEPAADERPGAFRKRLFETLRKRLPDSHEWASTPADDIPASARGYIEAQVIEAARQEGLRPSPENLPPSGLVRRDEVDPMTGARTINWHGRESFIKQMGREGQRVVRFLNPKNGQVVMGEPLPKAW